MSTRALLQTLVLIAAGTIGIVYAQAGSATAFPVQRNQWTLVYEHDAVGTPVNGSLPMLIAAIRNGADVKIATQGNDIFYRGARTSVATINGQVHAVIQFEDIALVNGTGPPVLRPEPYHTYSWHDSTGAQALLRTSVFDDRDLGRTISAVGLRWWVRT